MNYGGKWITYENELQSKMNCSKMNYRIKWIREENELQRKGIIEEQIAE